MKLISPLTKRKQNIYGAWAIEIYSTIWVLSEYERGQIYDLPEENTSQLTIIMIMLLLLLIIIKTITLRRREKNLSSILKSSRGLNFVLYFYLSHMC